MTNKLTAKDTAVEVVAADGTKVSVPTRQYKESVKLDPSWKLGEDAGLIGHEAGYYADHENAEVQRMAYEWRVAANTTEGYQALRLQSGTALWQAARAWEKANKLPKVADARRARVAASKAAAKAAAAAEKKAS